MAQQVVDFYLPSAVQHGKPLESRLLVGGVVIDAGARVLGKPFDHEVDSGLEGGLLLLAAVGPERVEPLVLLLCGYHAEQVLESALKQGIALHVEERSEEHTSELQSLMRNSYAVFCLKKKKNKT